MCGNRDVANQLSLCPFAFRQGLPLDITTARRHVDPSRTYLGAGGILSLGSVGNATGSTFLAFGSVTFASRSPAMSLRSGR